MKMMLVGVTLVAFGLSGCDTPGQTVGLGAGVGAVGAANVGANPVIGAIVGASVGAICEVAEGCN